MSNVKRHPTTVATGGITVAALALCGACGQQATEDYAGEPLLQMNAQALIEAPTGGEAVVPALCLFGARQEDRSAFDLDALPADVGALFQWPVDPGLPVDHPPLNSAPPDPQRTFIIDGETQGDFPSNFAFSVYQAPPADAVASDFDGEPAAARGSVCATRPEHASSSYRVYYSGIGACSPTACYELSLLASTDDPARAYVESRLCPPYDEAVGDPFIEPNNCTTQTAGDPSLMYEAHSEFVIGADHEHALFYLAEPAAPDSHMAWSLGLAEGLSAGYHLFIPPPLEEQASRWQCRGEVMPAAMAEIKATFEAELKARLGEHQSLDMFPLVVSADGTRIEYLPEDLYRGGKRIIAEHEMASCPLPPRFVEVDLKSETVAFSINIDPEFQTNLLSLRN